MADGRHIKNRYTIILDVRKRPPKGGWLIINAAIPVYIAAMTTSTTTIKNRQTTTTISNFSRRVLRRQQFCWDLCPVVDVDVIPLPSANKLTPH